MANGGNVIFVGNIPYDLSEEQIVDILRQSGPVKSFKLVIDNETGRARGYGFCEYFDPETAASAIRNLSNYDIGKRKLRVDYAQNEQPIQNRASGTNGSGGSIGSGAANQGPMMQPLIPDAIGIVPPRGTPIPELILKTLSQYQPAQLIKILMQIKGLIHTQQECVRQLLEQNPQLSFALFQILLMLKLVDPTVLQTVLANPNAMTSNGPSRGVMPNVGQASMQQPFPIGTAPLLQPNSQQVPQMLGHHMQIPPVPILQQHQAAPGITSYVQPPLQSAAMRPLPTMQQPIMGQNLQFPQQFQAQSAREAQMNPQQPYQQHGPPLFPPPRPQTPFVNKDNTDQQKALIAQVMALSDNEISALPPDQRAQIIKFRQSVSMGLVPQ